MTPGFNFAVAGSRKFRPGLDFGVVALVLPVAITAMVLAEVAWNRSSGRGPIVLTQREATLYNGSGDRSMSALWLSWQQRSTPAWDSGAGRQRGFAALELRDDPRRAGASRLMVVDVAADAATLMRRYPDGRTHIITAAQIMVPAGQSIDAGWVVSVEPGSIHVPRDLGLPPRGPFEIELWYGANHEPWIGAIRPTPPNGPALR